MSHSIASHIDHYLGDLQAILDQMRPDLVTHFEAIVPVLEATRLGGNRIFTMGNGGSGAAASHLTNDLNKYPSIPEAARYSCLSLVDNMPHILAVANDMSYDDVFVEQLRSHLQAGDVLIGISGSGNSENCVRALDYAREVGAATITWTGYGGGTMSKQADYALVIPSDSMVRCEDVHLIIHHCLVSHLADLVKATASSQ